VMREGWLNNISNEEFAAILLSLQSDHIAYDDPQTQRLNEAMGDREFGRAVRRSFESEPIDDDPTGNPGGPTEA
jgi:hypothetical protein